MDCNTNDPENENSAVIRLRSAAFVMVAGLTTFIFALTYPIAILSPRIMWVILSRYIRMHLAYLRLICGIDYRLTGLQNLPDGPCILASRHESMWETVFLPWALGNPAVLLKQEIQDYPIAGAVARSLDYIGIDRSGDLDAARRSFAKAARIAGTGRSILIFPSGTRDPAHRDRVQGGVAVLYRQLQLPCVPIILNSGDYWVYGSWLRLPGTIRVEILPAIPAGLPTGVFVARLEAALAQPLGRGASPPDAVPVVAASPNLRQR